MLKFNQGVFKPKNKEKYKGNIDLIIWRSSWELRLMSWLDAHPDVIEWSSEEVIIPYISPVDNKYHRYFPDFKVKMRSSNGDIETVLIEVKPFNQTIEPIIQKKKTKRYVNEVLTYTINKTKWKAAEKYCKKMGWNFKIFTENELGIVK